MLEQVPRPTQHLSLCTYAAMFCHEGVHLLLALGRTNLIPAKLKQRRFGFHWLRPLGGSPSLSILVLGGHILALWVVLSKRATMDRVMSMERTTRLWGVGNLIKRMAETALCLPSSVLISFVSRQPRIPQSEDFCPYLRLLVTRLDEKAQQRNITIPLPQIFRRL